VVPPWLWPSTAWRLSEPKFSTSSANSPMWRADDALRGASLRRGGRGAQLRRRRRGRRHLQDVRVRVVVVVVDIVEFVIISPAQSRARARARARAASCGLHPLRAILPRRAVPWGGPATATSRAPRHDPPSRQPTRLSPTSRPGSRRRAPLKSQERERTAPGRSPGRLHPGRECSPNCGPPEDREVFYRISYSMLRIVYRC
jgi:hypothetical protein